MGNNAVNYGDRERSVTVTLSQTESHASIAVQNWGPLISLSRIVIFCSINIDEPRLLKPGERGVGDWGRPWSKG